MHFIGRTPHSIITSLSSALRQGVEPNKNARVLSGATLCSASAIRSQIPKIFRQILLTWGEGMLLFGSLSWLPALLKRLDNVSKRVLITVAGVWQIGNEVQTYDEFFQRNKYQKTVRIHHYLVALRGATQH
jgi:hypothetical protein